MTITTGSIIKGEGDKYSCDTKRIIFIKGAHNLGPVYETRQIKTAVTTITSGMGVEHDSGAGGEDEWIVGADKSGNWYGVAEYSPEIVALVSTAYAALDEIKVLPFHLNFGAYLQSISCVDPGAAVECDDGLVSGSGTAGIFKAMTEMAFEAGSQAAGYQFQVNTWGTNASAGTQHYSRIYMRQAYYLAAPSDAYTCVAYIVGC